MIKNIKDLRRLLQEEEEEENKDREDVFEAPQEEEKERGGEWESVEVEAEGEEKEGAPQARGRCINMPEEAARLLEGYRQYMSFLSELGINERASDIRSKIGERLIEVLKNSDEWKVIIELIEEHVRKSS